MKSPTDDIINVLIPKYFSGNITDVEQSTLENWIAEDPKNKIKIGELEKLWKYTGKFNPSHSEPLPLSLNIDQEWEHQINLQKVQKDEKTIPIGRHIPSFSWYKIAASIALILGVAFAIFYYAGGFGRSYYAESVSKEVSFKDGTLVTLNTGSEIRLMPSYNKKARIVAFEGEAYFNVTPDKEKPFIIETNQARIRVVGTSFNVRSVADEDMVEVTVTSGEVLLLNEAGDRAVALKVDEMGTFNRLTGEISRKENNDPNFLSWKTRILQFEDSSLQDVIETINRTYPGNSIILRTEVTSQCSITVSFEDQSIEAILNVLESTLDLTYLKKGDTIEITGAGC